MTDTPLSAKDYLELAAEALLGVDCEEDGFSEFKIGTADSNLLSATELMLASEGHEEQLLKAFVRYAQECLRIANGYDPTHSSTQSEREEYNVARTGFKNAKTHQYRFQYLHTMFRATSEMIDRRVPCSEDDTVPAHLEPLRKLLENLKSITREIDSRMDHSPR